MGVSGVLAENVNNFGDTRGGALAGPLGLLIIVLLAIATVLLIRNMNKRLRRLPQSFPVPGEEAEAAAPGTDVTGDTDQPRVVTATETARDGEAPPQR